MAMKPNEKPRHLWYQRVEDMSGAIEVLENRGYTVYHACASFVEKSRRRSENALAAKAFWMDLDVGEGNNKFADKKVAAKALAEFIIKVHLPHPSYLLDSGGGLHAYWVLEEDIDIARWRTYAEMLKRLAAFHQFNCDPVRTADAASVLRPVGSHNFKYEPPRKVTVCFTRRLYPVHELLATISSAEERIGPPARVAATAKVSPNAAFAVKPTYTPGNADTIAQGCAQMREVRDTGGNVPEPQWYGAIQVLAFCRNGAALAHQWSMGYEGYKHSEVEERLARVKEMGPTTCATFEGRNPAGCRGCPHRGRITSPILLGQGTTVETPDDLVVGEEGQADDETRIVRPEMPDEFERNSDGEIWYKPRVPDDKNKACLVSPFDIYAKELAYDQVQRCEVAIVECHFPNAPVTEIVVPTHKIASARELEAELRRNHVKVGNANKMRDYFARQVVKIERIKTRRNFYSAFGWKDGTNQFVLGDQVYFLDGHVESAALADVLKPMAEAMRPSGSVADWVNATRHLNGPHMAAHAFMFGASIAAPLVKFTGYEGLLINAVGRSNSGKTSMGRFGISAFGNFEVLRLKQRDTGNAKIQRLAHLGSLPGYVDEITNEDPERMSDFVYEVTQGRSKLRLRQDGVERPTYEWSTLVVSSSNTSVHTKLGLAKANPEAERLRVFEFPLDRTPTFSEDAAREIWRVSSATYGHVGPLLIRYLMENQHKVKEEMDLVALKIADVAKMKPEERMWSAGIASVIYALMLLKRLGLSRIEPGHVIKWLVAEIHALRQSMEAVHYEAMDLLGIYINEFSANRLTVRELKPTRAGAPPDIVVERYPVREMVMRYEATTGRLFVNVDHYRTWLATKHEAYTRHLGDLKRAAVYVGLKNKNLGAGTPYSGLQVRSLEFDMGAGEAAAVMQVVANDAGHEQRRREMSE